MPTDCHNYYKEDITFDSICKLLRKLGFPYYLQADELGITTKTLQRWREKETPYTQLSNEHYARLFGLLEKACRENKYNRKNYLDVLRQRYNLHEQNIDDVTQLVINSLDYHIGRTNSNPENFSSSEITPESFFNSCLYSEEKIKSIYMAFYSGANWVKIDKKLDFLKDLSDNIEIRVLVNDQKTIGEISETMKDLFHSITYLGYDDIIELWHRLSNELANLDFKISNFPLFRKIYIVNFEGGSSEALVRDYAYGYNIENQEQNKRLSGNNTWLSICKQEFELLWNKSLTYEDWISNVVK